MKTAAFFLVVWLATSLGCNSILGIDPANLDTSDASTASTPPAEAAACSLRAKDPCNSCIAENCCSEYEACINSPTCKTGLVEYAFCLGNSFTNMTTGATCDEDFLSVAGQESGNLAICAFMSNCTSECKDQTVGDLCFTYCNCMDDVCPGALDPGTCEDTCANFDPLQLVCRPYHCNLAIQNRNDETKRTLHCGHASGNTPCH